MFVYNLVLKWGNNFCHIFIAVVFFLSYLNYEISAVIYISLGTNFLEEFIVLYNRYFKEKVPTSFLLFIIMIHL